jgi:hypothetical protein
VHTGFLWENLTEGNHLEYPSVNERIILKGILEKWGREAWTGLT